MDQEPTSSEAVSERAPDLAILTRVEAELAEVERALLRLDEGTYGTCQACGTTIDDARLASEPAAAFCAEHAPG